MKERQYRIVVKRSALKEIRRIPGVALERIRSHIASLADDPWPRGAEKIQGYDDYYRIRVGRFRVIYEVKRSLRMITIIRIAHRREVYRGL